MVMAVNERRNSASQVEALASCESLGQESSLWHSDDEARLSSGRSSSDGTFMGFAPDMPSSPSGAAGGCLVARLAAAMPIHTSAAPRGVTHPSSAPIPITRPSAAAAPMPPTSYTPSSMPSSMPTTSPLAAYCLQSLAHPDRDDGPVALRMARHLSRRHTDIIN